MYTPTLEKYLTFINSERQHGPPRRRSERADRLAVTISRQSGSGAHVIAEKLAEHLQAQAPPGSDPWLVFDRNLAEKVLEDNNLPKHLARYMPEDRISAITDTIDELFGLHPPFWTLVEKTARTILCLAEQGNVILIGRGANIITAGMQHVLHVRLVGSPEKRAAHVQQIQGIDRKIALELIVREDRGRQRYFKKYFGKDLNDPSLYHLVINTDLISYDQAARLIGETVLNQNAVRTRV